MNTIDKKKKSLHFIISEIERNEHEMDMIRIKLELMKEKMKELDERQEYYLNQHDNDIKDSIQIDNEPCKTKEMESCIDKDKISNIETARQTDKKVKSHEDIHSKQVETQLNQLKKNCLTKSDELQQLRERNCRLEELMQFVNHVSRSEQQKGYSNQNDLGTMILELQENEKQRIARDLHDSTIQNLTALIHKTELCIRTLDVDTVETKLELMTMINIMKSNITELRNIIYDMRPMILDDIGLIAAIQKLNSNILSTTEISDIKFDYSSHIEEANMLIKTSLYRTLVEALNNIVKHANASIIEIKLVVDNGLITLSIRDNGVGFDIEHYDDDEYHDKSKHYGIPIMRERISLLGGKFSIQSRKNNGTYINITLSMDIKEPTNV